MSKFKKYSGASFKELCKTSYCMEPQGGEEYLVIDLNVLEKISTDPKVLFPLVNRVADAWVAQGRAPKYVITTDQQIGMPGQTTRGGVLKAGRYALLTHAPDSNWHTVLLSGDRDMMRWVMGRVLGADLGHASIVSL
jgi:hypothetical protein